MRSARKASVRAVWRPPRNEVSVTRCLAPPEAPAEGCAPRRNEVSVKRCLAPRAVRECSPGVNEVFDTCDVAPRGAPQGVGVPRAGPQRVRRAAGGPLTGARRSSTRGRSRTSSTEATDAARTGRPGLLTSARAGRSGGSDRAVPVLAFRPRRATQHAPSVARTVRRSLRTAERARTSTVPVGRTTEEM